MPLKNSQLAVGCISAHASDSADGSYLENIIVVISALLLSAFTSDQKNILLEITFWCWNLRPLCLDKTIEFKHIKPHFVTFMSDLGCYCLPTTSNGFWKSHFMAKHFQKWDCGKLIWKPHVTNTDWRAMIFQNQISCLRYQPL